VQRVLAINTLDFFRVFLAVSHLSCIF